MRPATSRVLRASAHDAEMHVRHWLAGSVLLAPVCKQVVCTTMVQEVFW